jgi:hypothetical protein
MGTGMTGLEAYAALRPEPLCVRPSCKANRRAAERAPIDLERVRADLGRARAHIAELEADLAYERELNERLSARFDWGPLGGPEFARRFTPRERLIVEMLRNDGESVPYPAFCRAAWPDREWPDTSRTWERSNLRGNLYRIREKLAGTAWEIVTDYGYGLALRRRTP